MNIHHADWPNYFFHLDFVDYKDFLQNIPLGVLSAEHVGQMVGMMSMVDTGEGRESWTDSSPTNEWALEGVEVIYNGVNKQSLPTKSLMKYTMGLVFPDSSVGPLGRVYFCWNDPVVPAEPVELPTGPADEEEEEV